MRDRGSQGSHGLSQFQQLVSVSDDAVGHGLGTPGQGDAFLAVEGARDLAVHSAGGVRVVSEIDREQGAVGERGALIERPESGLKGPDSMA